MDFFEIQIFLIEQLSKYDDIEVIVGNYLDQINEFVNESAIEKLRKCNYAADFHNIEQSLIHTLSKEQPKIKVKGYWFGLCNRQINGNIIYQAYISGSNKSTKDQDSIEWAVQPKYFPGSRYFKSSVLEEFSKSFGNRSNNFEIDYFPLWYLMIVIGVFSKKNYQMLLNSRKCLIAVGFDGGDFVNIGNITSGN